MDLPSEEICEILHISTSNRHGILYREVAYAFLHDQETGSAPAMSKLMYSCKQASRLSSRAMEQPLGTLERLLLRLHLMMCGRCRNFTRRIEFLRRASRKALEKDEG